MSSFCVESQSCLGRLSKIRRPFHFLSVAVIFPNKCCINLGFLSSDTASPADVFFHLRSLCRSCSFQCYCAPGSSWKINIQYIFCTRLRRFPALSTIEYNFRNVSHFRWELYTPLGRRIPGTPFVPFKCPLSQVSQTNKEYIQIFPPGNFGNLWIGCLF